MNYYSIAHTNEQQQPGIREYKLEVYCSPHHLWRHKIKKITGRSLNKNCDLTSYFSLERDVFGETLIYKSFHIFALLEDDVDTFKSFIR